MKTEDGGRTWNVLESGSQNVFWGHMEFVDENNGWISVRDKNNDSKYILHTIDGGISWERYEVPLSFGYCGSLEFINEKSGWITEVCGLCNSKLFFTEDAGKSWVLIYQFNEYVHGKCKIYASSPNTLWHVGNGSSISYDGGYSWEWILDENVNNKDQYSGLSVREMIPVDSRKAYFIYYYHGGLMLAFTENLGETITPLFVFENYPQAMETAGKKFWMVSNNGQIIKYTPEGMSVEKSFARSSLLTLDAPFPNPFNPATTIRFELTERSDVELVVYDVTGQKVATLINDTIFNAGTYDIVFDGSGLASGVYVYLCRAGTTSESGTMVMIK